jgi:hypothetical protein
VKFGGVKPHICRFSEKILSARLAAAFADLKCDFTAFSPPGSRFKQMKNPPIARLTLWDQKIYRAIHIQVPGQAKNSSLSVLLTHCLLVFSRFRLFLAPI